MWAPALSDLAVHARMTVSPPRNNIFKLATEKLGSTCSVEFGVCRMCFPDHTAAWLRNQEDFLNMISCRSRGAHFWYRAAMAAMYDRGAMTSAHGAAAVSMPIARYRAPASPAVPSKDTPVSRRRATAPSVSTMTALEYQSVKLCNRVCSFGLSACTAEL